MKPLRKLFTLALPIAAVSAGGVWMLNPPASRQQFAYDTVDVTTGPIRKIVATSGPVRALVTVSIGSQLSGQIEKMNADFNSEVKEGDILATIDDRTYAARVLQARADLAVANAALTNQQASLKRSDAVILQAERNQVRQDTLQKKGFAAQSALDTATRDLDVARADADVARAQIDSAKAGIEQKQAALKQAEVDLERTKILAPINGTVISRTADVGQTVAASLQAPELFKLAQDLSRIRIEAQVNEADVGTIADGNAVTFTVDAYPERTFVGKVTQVRLSATELQNIVTYTVIIEASNEDRRLFPGMTANVQIEVAKKESVMRVANDALRFRPRGAATGSESRGAGAGRSGGERQLSKLKLELELTDEQETKLRDAIKSAFAERGSGQQPSSGDDGTAARQKMRTVIEQALAPLLSEAQKPLFAKWKLGRENVRNARIYVLSDAGLPEGRSVRLGISDDQFTEIAGGQITSSERVVTRARDLKR